MVCSGIFDSFISMENDPWAEDFSIHELSIRSLFIPILVIFSELWQDSGWMNHREILGIPIFNVFLFLMFVVLSVTSKPSF